MPFQENSQQPWEIEPAKSPADLAPSVQVSRFLSGIKMRGRTGNQTGRTKRFSRSRIVNRLEM